jgi:hypothetical protein
MSNRIHVARIKKCKGEDTKGASFPLDECEKYNFYPIIKTKFNTPRATISSNRYDRDNELLRNRMESNFQEINGN